MADDGDDWFAGGDDEPPPVIKPLGKKGEEEAAAPAAEAEAAEGEAPPAEGEAAGEEKREEAEDEYLDPDKLILFKHWIRPKFLPYRCLYEYRLNYYDDVLEAIASRRRGVKRDIPRAQTWAERMVRLERDPIYKLNKFDRFLDDVRFVTKTEISGQIHVYNSKEQVNRRFSKLLF